MFCAILSGVGLGAIIVFCLRKRIHNSFGIHDTSQEEEVENKIVIITGANKGLGLETAKQFFMRGSIVILACRNEILAEYAIEKIKRTTGYSKGKLVKMKLDLASLDSIREFVKKFKEKFDKLHILINNAGVYVPLKEKQKTQDGFEINFGVNHLGHFLLTNLLLDSLENGAPGRVITVSSTLSQSAQLDFEDLMMEKANSENLKVLGFSGEKVAYSNSKLANALFSRHLATILSGTSVHSYCVCPGWLKTDLVLQRREQLNWKNFIFIFLASFLFMRTPLQGSYGVLHCALSKKCADETGKLYRNCKLMPSWKNLNDANSKRLWDLSSNLVNLDK